MSPRSNCMTLVKSLFSWVFSFYLWGGGDAGGDETGASDQLSPLGPFQLRRSLNLYMGNVTKVASQYLNAQLLLTLETIKGTNSPTASPQRSSK